MVQISALQHLLFGPQRMTSILVFGLIIVHGFDPAPGMARMCCDSRRSVRQTAITYLQRALLAHDLQHLSAAEWGACFTQVREGGCGRGRG